MSKVFGKYRGRLVGVVAVLLVALAMLQGSSPLDWRVERGVLVLEGAPASDHSPATQGQLKNFARAAMEEMGAQPGTPVYDMVAAWRADKTQAKDHAVATIGQLKAVAKPIYDQLGLSYPWTATTADDANSAPATVGQLKAVFNIYIPTPTPTPSLVSPTIFSVAERSDGGVAITWIDNSANESGFSIQRSDDGGQTWITIGSTSVNTTSYNAPSSASGQSGTSIFRVTANNSSGSSSASSHLSSQIPADDDWDEDGLSNEEEIEIGTRYRNPQTDKDTDGDGLNDNEEAMPTELTVKMPWVSDSGCVTIPIAKLGGSDDMMGLPVVNDKGQVAVRMGDEQRFWDPATGWTPVPVTGDYNYIKGIDNAGNVYYSVSDEEAEREGYASSFIPEQKVVRWSLTGGVQSFDMTSDSLGGHLQQLSDARWSGVVSETKSDIEDEISDLNDQISDLEDSIADLDPDDFDPWDDPTYEEVLAGYQEAIQVCNDKIDDWTSLKGFLPLTFDINTLIGAEESTSDGYSSIYPIAFNDNGEVVFSYDESFSIWGKSGKYFGAYRTVDGYGIYDGSTARSMSVGGIPAEYISISLAASGVGSGSESDMYDFTVLAINNSNEMLVMQPSSTPDYRAFSFATEESLSSLPEGLDYYYGITDSIQDGQHHAFVYGGHYEENLGEIPYFAHKVGSTWQVVRFTNAVASEGYTRDGSDINVSNRLEFVNQDTKSIWRNSKYRTLDSLVSGPWFNSIPYCISKNTGVVVSRSSKYNDQNEEEEWLCVQFPAELITEGSSATHPERLEARENVSNPIPEVDLSLQSAQITSDGDKGILHVAVEGSIEDPLSGTIDDASKRVQNLVFSVAGKEIDSITGLPGLSPGQGKMPWHPYKLEHQFTKNLDIPFDSSNSFVTLRATSSPNAVGSQGWDEITFWIDRVQQKQSLGSNEIPSFSFAGNLTSSVQDSVAISFGSSGISGTLTEIENYPASLVFRGSLTIPGGASVEATLRIFGASWNSSTADEITAQLEYALFDGTTKTIAWRWAETSASSLDFVALPGAFEMVSQPVLTAATAGRRSPHGSFNPFIMRVEGTEDFFTTSQIKLLRDSQPQTLKGFTYSPKRYYIPTSDGSRPQLYVVTTAALPDNLPSALPPGVSVIEDETQKIGYKLQLNGQSYDATGVEIFDSEGIVKSVVPDDNPKELTLDKVMGFYRIFFGEEGLNLLGLHNAAGTSISVEHRGWYKLGFGGPGYCQTFRPGTLAPVIGIYDDVDPITAAIYLYDSLRACIGANYAVDSNLISYYSDPADAANKLLLARQNFTANMIAGVETAADAAKLIVGIANDGADVIITLGDAADGKTGAGAVILSTLPFVTGVSGKYILKEGENVILELTESAKESFDAIANLFRRASRNPLTKYDWTRRSDILKKFVEGVNEGKWTEETMRTMIVRMRELEPEVLIDTSLLTKAGKNSARERLKTALKAAGKNPPTDGLKYEANHYLPVEFDTFFLKHGFDIHSADYGEWIEASAHRRYHNIGVEIPGEGRVKFNDFWNNFIREEPSSGYSRTEIINKFNEAKTHYPFPFD